MKPIEYIPETLNNPRLHKVPTAWGDIPQIIKDIIIRFELDTKIAVDIGTATGYSASAFANYFDKVITLDTFKGDSGEIKSDDPINSYKVVKKSLSDAGFNNIEVIQSDFRDFIKDNDNKYNIIHIDIVHLYDPTFECGEWAVNHADCVVFHDTMSFPEVMKAVEDLSEKYNLRFFNYTKSWGLGILVK
jgi:predicted O-methyltransferase YrrM